MSNCFVSLLFVILKYIMNNSCKGRAIDSNNIRSVVAKSSHGYEEIRLKSCDNHVVKVIH